MAPTRIFLFGTLRHAPLLRLVAGRDLPLVPATLPGARCERALGGDWPVLVEDPAARAEGVLVEADAEALRRLDWYEAVFGYDRAPVEVETEGGRLAAQVWRPRHDDPGSGEHWSLTAWAEAWAPLTCEAAPDILRRIGRQEPDEVGRIAGIVRARADAVLRACQWRRPGRVGGRFGHADAEILARRHPYDGFYATEEITARHRRFDGAEEREVVRAIFRVGDASTVLPYDPVRDRILLVEQIRFGALVQGDPSPWLLEPVAGLIDAGETPEEAARREAAEEAGLALQGLHFVARYYPSPGGLAHVLFSYVGIADLPDGSAGLGGHEDEGEDIQGHLVTFDGAMALMETGDLVNAPAIISLQWLAANRARLRAEAGIASGAG
ncbi:gamma-glutamylcyclotransferase [Roseibacterium sp. SDUM158017]|uniref:gamma-glutamylcyclotransferase n=1 Tax=Roseicyclus salinarum TaxID=3036773 RepID=UPI0024152537|nr:gamma-glutamylcyclotransferase [Roseibacterium sp. SDUM158017]MDG4648947.1 gamma-glutamylcyclotransferase [Roseibacterium sp. SDUM158017]